MRISRRGNRPEHLYWTPSGQGELLLDTSVVTLPAGQQVAVLIVLRPDRTRSIHSVVGKPGS